MRLAAELSKRNHGFKDISSKNSTRKKNKVKTGIVPEPIVTNKQHINTKKIQKNPINQNTKISKHRERPDMMTRMNKITRRSILTAAT